MSGLNTNTKLLLHLNGPDGSTVMTDESDSGHIVTPVGTAQLFSANSKFGTGSFLGNGASAHMVLPDSPDWDFGTGDFTIECWTYIDTFETEHCLLSSSTSGELLFNLDNPGTSPNMFIKLEGTNYFFGDPSITEQTWNHYALTRESGTLRVFVNGVQVGSDQTANDNINIGANLRIGGRVVNNRNINGNLDEFRISNIARYTSDFTPQTEEFSPDANTKLLLHLNNNTDDSSASAHSVSLASGGIIVNSVFMNSFLDLDGNSDYLTIPDSNDWNIYDAGHDFTIDLWVKHTSSISGDRAYLAHFEDINNFWQIRAIFGNQLDVGLRVASTFEVTMSGGSLVVGQWHHVTITRVGSDIGLYLDGTQIDYASYGGAVNFNSPLYIGQRGDSTGYFEGYMDEIRIQHNNAFNASPNVGLSDTIIVPTEEYSLDQTAKFARAIIIT